MARGRKHTAEQIGSPFGQAEVAVSSGKTTAQASKEASITEQTYYRWRKEFGGKKPLCRDASFLFYWFGLIEDILFTAAIPPCARQCVPHSSTVEHLLARCPTSCLARLPSPGPM
jgi:hypothetical protein